VNLATIMLRCRHSHISAYCGDSHLTFFTPPVRLGAALGYLLSEPFVLLFSSTKLIVHTILHQPLVEMHTLRGLLRCHARRRSVHEMDELDEQDTRRT
jgi:hypothetical protein